MKKLVLILLATSVATPALAQHSGHTMPMPAPQPAANPTTKPVADARKQLRKEHGGIVAYKVLIDQLETGKDGYAWDAQGWYGHWRGYLGRWSRRALRDRSISHKEHRRKFA